MKHLSQYINESFITLWQEDKEEMMKLEYPLWDMLKGAYSYLATRDCPSGILNVEKWKDVVDECDMVKIGKRNGRIVACQFYKLKPSGRKVFLGCCDDSREGKEMLAQIFKEDFRVAGRNGYVEVSDKAEQWLINKLGFDKHIIPNDKVQKILGKEVELCDDGIHYIRQIGGEKHQKVLVGNPK